MITDPNTLIDQLELIRQHFCKAIELSNSGQPFSSATEELAGTRKINNMILDLKESVAKQNRIATKRKKETEATDH